MREETPGARRRADLVWAAALFGLALAAFLGFRRDPWPSTPAMHRALHLAGDGVAALLQCGQVDRAGLGTHLRQALGIGAAAVVQHVAEHAELVVPPRGHALIGLAQQELLDSVHNLTIAPGGVMNPL